MRHYARSASLLLLITILLSSALRAQSPYRLDPVRETVLFGGGIALFATGYGMQSNTVPLTAGEIAVLDPADIPAFDRAATENYSVSAADASDMLLGASLLAPAILIADDGARSDAITIGVMYVETGLLSLALPAIAKTLTRRTRPYAYNDNVPFSEKTGADARHSFFSGHATLAFSSVVFLNVVYGDYNPSSPLRPWLWGGGLLLAGSVGVLRVTAGKHFLSDVLVGALVGSAVGWAVPALHRTGEANWSVGLAPLPGGGEASFTLSF